MATHLGLGLLDDITEDRLVKEVEEEVPGQVGDRMLAARGGRGESFEALSCLACREEVQRLCLGEMALEDGDDDGGNVRYPGEGARPARSARVATP